MAFTFLVPPPKKKLKIEAWLPKEIVKKSITYNLGQCLNF